MKQVLFSLMLWTMSIGLYAQIIPPPYEPWFKASVLAIDRPNRKIWARGTEDGKVISFTLREEHFKWFHKGREFSARILAKSLDISGKDIPSGEARIGVPDLVLSTISGMSMMYKLAVLDGMPAYPVKKNELPSYGDMGITSGYEQTQIKACCFEGTNKGIILIPPPPVTRDSMAKKIYVYKEFAITENAASYPHTRVFPISGHWIDSTRSTAPSSPDNWEQGAIAARPNTAETDEWVAEKPNPKNLKGRLFVVLPKGTAFDITIYADGSSKVISNTMLQTSFNLAPGLYDLEINHIKINGIPVLKGSEIRLKTGVLHITSSESWTLYDFKKQTVLINSLSAEKRGLPVGRYKLTISGQDRDIEIKDGETLEF